MYKFFGNIFYPYDKKESYLSAGSWPNDGYDVSDEDFNYFINPPSGKKLSTGGNGEPVFIEDDSLIGMELSVRDVKKKNLMDEAMNKISPLQDAVDLGVATEEESASLLAWKKYRVDLMRTDISADEISWPDSPAT